ncbi:MAG: SAM-dependent methyltransferase [Pleurocapsa sp.]
MKLSQVVPFGRSLDEYRKMFALSESELKTKSILGVGDGPASFNAQATPMGANITSIDPIYQFSGAEIKQRFDAVVDNIIEQVIASPNVWVWSYHTSPQTLKASRIKTLELFLADYESGKQEQRYLTAELPSLDFSEWQFDLALCSHFLFLYSQHCSRTFHFESIREMLRVSREVRIFPLLTLSWETSPYLDFILREFQALGYSVAITEVQYELQKGGNKMLVIK